MELAKDCEHEEVAGCRFREVFIGVSRGVPWVPAGTTLGSGAHFDLRLGDASLSSDNPQSARESTLSVS